MHVVCIRTCNHTGMAGHGRELAIVIIAFLENKLDRQDLVETSLDWSGPVYGDSRVSSGHRAHDNFFRLY